MPLVNIPGIIYDIYCMDLKNFTRLPFYIKLACVLFSLFALGALVILAKEILSPLIFSCLFAMLLMPLARFFERRIRLIYPRNKRNLLQTDRYRRIVPCKRLYHYRIFLTPDIPVNGPAPQNY